MEHLSRNVAERTGKSKLIVDSRVGKMIVNSRKWDSGVCGKGVHGNSVQCTVYKK